MSTPVVSLVSYSKNIFFMFSCMWIFTLFVSRLYTFHNALQVENTRRINERWLLQKCDEPEFYFHLKEHTDLCAMVVSNSNSNRWLNALYQVATSTHMCGITSCTDMIHQFVQKIGWQMVGLLLLLALFSPNLFYLLYRTSVRSSNKYHERGLMGLARRRCTPVEETLCAPFYPDMSEDDRGFSSLKYRNSYPINDI